MSKDDRNGHNNGQQGSGGLDDGRAISAPNPQGSQPHLGNAANRSARSAPDGTGETQGDSERRITAPGHDEALDALDEKRATSRHNDRLGTIAAADGRTGALNPHRGTRANDATGHLRNLLSSPASNEDYLGSAQHEAPALGTTEDDVGTM